MGNPPVPCSLIFRRTMNQLDAITPGEGETPLQTDLFTEISREISLQDMLLNAIVEGTYTIAPQMYEKEDNTVTVHVAKLKKWCPKFELMKFVKFMHRPVTLISQCEIKLDGERKPNDLLLTSLHPDFVIERINNFCQLCNSAGTM